MQSRDLATADLVNDVSLGVAAIDGVELELAGRECVRRVHSRVQRLAVEVAHGDCEGVLDIERRKRTYRVHARPSTQAHLVESVTATSATSEDPVFEASVDMRTLNSGVIFF